MPIPTSIPDLWWLKPGPDTVGPAMRWGIELGQRNRDNQINRDDRLAREALVQSNWERDFGARTADDVLKRNEIEGRLKRQADEEAGWLAFDEAVNAERKRLAPLDMAPEEVDMRAIRAGLPKLRSPKQQMEVLSTLGNLKNKAQQIQAQREKNILYNDLQTLQNDRRKESSDAKAELDAAKLELAKSREENKLSKEDEIDLNEISRQIIDSSRARAKIAADDKLDAGEKARSLRLHDAQHGDLLLQKKKILNRIKGILPDPELAPLIEDGETEAKPSKDKRYSFNARTGEFNELTPKDGIKAPAAPVIPDQVVLPSGETYTTTAGIENDPQVQRARIQAEIQDTKRFLSRAGKKAPETREVDVPVIPSSGFDSFDVKGGGKTKVPLSIQEKLAHDATVIAASKKLKELQAVLKAMSSELE